jgi:carboxypeptidase Q
VVVSGLEELGQLGEAGVKDKIVLFNEIMPPPDPETGDPHYGESSSSRFRGPRAAAKLGASAALVRSVTARSLRSPHTGMTSFGKDKRIPAAAISTEDADLIARLATEGPVEVHVMLGAKILPDVASANVIGELRGREFPEQIVVIGAHLDSWDVGQGAHDDGAGCVIVMEALAIIKRLGLQPRRTIRVVLYTNEENGAEGADAYAKDHAAELPNHVAAIESDTGGFKPMGFMLDEEAAKAQGLSPKVFEQLVDIVTLLAPLDAARAIMGYGGTDISSIGEAAGNKTPLIGHWVDMRTYFDYHHTEADTLDKVDAKILQDNAVVMAIVAFVIADMPARLGE